VATLRHWGRRQEETVTVKSEFHPDLKLARFMPTPGGGERLARVVRRFKVPAARLPDDMVVENRTVPGRNGGPPVRLRFYRPRALAGVTPALLWMHGGGYFMGNVEQDDRRSMAIARRLGITVAAVAYRLAPEHPAPAALDDAYACLAYLHEKSAAHEIDPERIAIGGTSAGGGLAASLALLAHDLGEVKPVFQLLAYPVLDDRSALRTDRDDRNVRMYTSDSQQLTWRWYLGNAFGGQEVSEYAAPARRNDLTGLPPAWIGVCTFDVLYDEGVDYARRLNDSGVPCDLHVVEGGFHGFDVLFPRAGVTRTFREAQVGALRAALFPPE
jgi:acetyl esterase/lipase